MENEFWDKWYKGFDIHEPSNFAKFCLTRYINKNDTLVELGCGNGRDGLVLSNNVEKYIGLDASSSALKRFENEVESRGISQNISILQSNFCDQDFNKLAIDANRLVIYSRFSLHSIKYSDFEDLINNLQNISSSLSWVFLVEARTIFDDMYGVGENIGLHEFRTDHYRRFIDPKTFLAEMGNLFNIKYFEVSSGFAKFNESDPICLRASIHSNI
jgi:tellurite methyltransferase